MSAIFRPWQERGIRKLTKNRTGITITRSMTRNAGKSCMLIQASIVMYASLIVADLLIDNSDTKVAVAKHLGLMSLRLVQATVVPLNTTQYALDLSGYLDKYAFR